MLIKAGLLEPETPLAILLVFSPCLISYLPGVLIVSISSEIDGTAGMDCELMGAVLMGVFCGVGAITFLFFISTRQNKLI
jgi:cytochrome c biogenesis protein CcdA